MVPAACSKDSAEYKEFERAYIDKMKQEIYDKLIANGVSGISPDGIKVRSCLQTQHTLAPAAS
jgi:hypothetical protein